LTSHGKVDQQALPAPDEMAYVARVYETPVGHVEAALATIWMTVLKRERVGRHDNFFEIGGDSLRAVHVVKLLEQMDINISAVDLFMHPTIASLTNDLIAVGASALSNTPICIRPGGAERPLFLAPSGVGQLLYAPALAPHIDPDIPIYGLPPMPIHETMYRTVEGMAMRMLRMIRAIQPTGPYRVAGWSFGGILAYEIASQLIGADQDVDFLGAFDTYHEGSGSVADIESRITFDDRQMLLRLIERKVSTGGKEMDVLDELRLNAQTMDLTTFMTRCRDLGLQPARYQHLTPKQLEQTFARERAHLVANYKYYVQPLPIAVSLFVARASDPTCLPGWISVVASERLCVIPVDGDHQSIMRDPKVQPFGRLVSERILEAAENSCDIPERRYSPVAVLQSGRPDILPLFCIPGAGASVSSFVELTSALVRTQPIYGFQPRGLDGDLVPHATVEAAAECYLQHVDQLYPSGPVHLLGHSFGGWVALQIAQLLVDRGRSVGSLIIVDSEVPDAAGDPIREFDNTEAIMRWVDTFELVLGYPLGVTREEIGLRPPAQQRIILHGRLVGKGLMPVQSDPDLLIGPLRTFAAAIRTQYIPRHPYPGPARLVLVDDPRLEHAANQRNHWEVLNGWRALIPALSCTHSPANHMTVLRAPHVQTLANLINDQPAKVAGRT
jgi:arthrofactin-type cyclic lipopeptide synthetase C